MRFPVVGSPAYLARRGRPAVPADLRDHDTLGWLAGPSPLLWRFQNNGRDTALAPSGRLCTNSFDAIRHAAVAGHGLALLPEPHVREEIARGALEVVLRDHEHREVPIHALYTRDKASLPKVRAFVDFVAECLAADPGTLRSARRSSQARVRSTNER
jgi:DNA-binding transcriptional LysR family regulator